MDNLTHGLFGLAVGALRRPDGAPLSATDKAVLLGCVVAAELPDADYLWPAGDAVLQTLRAHRGPSHALVFAPVVAGLALLVARLVFRGARAGPVFAWSLGAVVVAHLLPDLWTGWGTRVLLPLSERRFALDWTGVLDPLVTLPLVAGTLWAWRRRAHWRRAVLAGLAVSGLYVGARIASREVLTQRVAEALPEASEVHVFPAFFGVTTWRFVAELPGGYAAGAVDLFGDVVEERRHAVAADGPLPPAVAAAAPVDEALQWARFPVVRHEASSDGNTRVRIADLRYHLRGEPTLTFVVDVGAGGAVKSSTLERGGSASALFERWRRR